MQLRTFKSIYWTGGASDSSTAQSPKINAVYPKRTLEAGTSTASHYLVTIYVQMK